MTEIIKTTEDDKVNDAMNGIHRMIGMPGIPGDSDGKGDYDEPAISRITLG